METRIPHDAVRPLGRHSQQVHSFRVDNEVVTDAAVNQSHRVLVVDDEPNIADVISMALRYQGFTVETAG